MRGERRHLQTRSFASLLVAATLSCVVGCSVDKNGLTSRHQRPRRLRQCGASASVGGSAAVPPTVSAATVPAGPPELAGPPEPAATTTKAPADGARVEWARAEPAEPAPAEARLVEKAPADRARADTSSTRRSTCTRRLGDRHRRRSAGRSAPSTSHPDVPVCDTTHGMHRCGDTCVSNSSPDSCGTTSCAACPVPANATATCDGTMCGFTCTAGFMPSGGACVRACDTNCGATAISVPLPGGRFSGTGVEGHVGEQRIVRRQQCPRGGSIGIVLTETRRRLRDHARHEVRHGGGFTCGAVVAARGDSLQRQPRQP